MRSHLTRRSCRQQLDRFLPSDEKSALGARPSSSLRKGAGCFILLSGCAAAQRQALGRQMTDNTSSGFMHKYYDWAALESFVKDLYEGDGEVTVERNVIEVDRYGAKRQTDVKIERRTRFHRFVTLVECKRWKEPVSRDRVDVLASSIEALGAQNGAIFTTTGFEEGAVAYAKGKGIEIFVVRDLTPEEWGLPGRQVWFYLETMSAEFKDISIPDVQCIALVDTAPGQIELPIRLQKELAGDPDHDLYSVQTGERGPNLVGLLGDTHGLILGALQGTLREMAEPNSVIELMAACEVDFTGTPFRQMRLPTVAARIEKIRFKFVAQISKIRMDFDRGKDLDFGVMIESYASEQRLLAHRRKGDPGIVFQVVNPIGPVAQDSSGDALVNGTTFSVTCAPWVGLGNAPASRKAFAGQLIRVIVDVVNRKPQLALRAEPLPGLAS